MGLKFISKVAITVTTILTAYIAPTYAETNAETNEVGIVRYIKGEVDVFRDNELIIMDVGDKVYKGDILRTKRGSKVEVELKDGNILRIGELTKVDFSEFDIEEDSKILKLLRGGIRAIIGKLKRDERFNVRTLNAVAGVKGTDFAVITNVFETNVVVFEGYVIFRNILEEVIGEVFIGAGQSSYVRGENPPTEPLEVPEGLLEGVKQRFEIETEREEVGVEEDMEDETAEGIGISELEGVEAEAGDVPEVPPVISDPTLREQPPLTENIKTKVAGTENTTDVDVKVKVKK